MKIRTRLVILKEFQTWFFLNFLFYTVLSLSLVAVGILCWIKLVSADIFKLAWLIRDPLISLIELNSKMGLIILGVLFVSMLVLSFFQAIIFSRKIAGPLFALTRHFEKCEARGKFEKFNFRKNDLFADIAKTFNRAVDRAESKSIERFSTKTAIKKIAGMKRFGRS